MFAKYNREYREEFGFPFVICARLNRKEAILTGFEKRLHNLREREIQIALEEIFKIAELRLRELLLPDSAWQRRYGPGCPTNARR